MYEDEIKAGSRKTTVRLALQEIADAQGDVDAFIAQYDESGEKDAQYCGGDCATAISGRPCQRQRWRRSRRLNADATDGRISIGRMRGSTRSRRLPAATKLRPHVGHASSGPSAASICASTSGNCLISKTWKPRSGLSSMWSVARISFRRSRSSSPGLPWTERRASSSCGQLELDGDHYEVLSPAADALAGKYPLAATLAAPGDDRFHARQGPIEPLPARSATLHGMRRSCIFDSGTGHLRDARSLCLAAEGRAWPQERDFGV